MSPDPICLSLTASPYAAWPPLGQKSLGLWPKNLSQILNYHNFQVYFLATIVREKCARWRCFMLYNLLYVFHLLLDFLFTKKINFLLYVYVKFNTFSVKYIFEKNATLSYRPLFIQIRFSRVILTI